MPSTIKLTVDAKDKASSKLRKIKGGLVNIGKAAAGAGLLAGGAVVAGAVAGVAAFTEWGDELTRLSKTTGQSVEELSALAHGFKLAGLDGEDLRDVFAELHDKRPGESLDDIADELAALKTTAEQTSFAMETFGDDVGLKVLPLLKEGSEGLQEMRDNADALGVTMSEEAAQGGADLKTNINDMVGILEGAGQDLFSEIVPDLAQLTEDIKPGLKKITGFLGDAFADGYRKAKEVFGLIITAWKMVYPSIKPGIDMLKQAFAGFAQAVLPIFEIVFDTLIQGVDWIVDQAKQAHNVLDSIFGGGQNQIDIDWENKPSVRGMIADIKAEQARMAREEQQQENFTPYAPGTFNQALTDRTMQREAAYSDSFLTPTGDKLNDLYMTGTDELQNWIDTLIDARVPLENILAAATAGAVNMEGVGALSAGHQQTRPAVHLQVRGDKAIDDDWLKEFVLDIIDNFLD